MQVSNEARDHLIPLLEDQNAKGIRLYFSGYGWGGPQIGVSLEEPQPQDVVKVLNQIQVAIDKEIVPYTKGLVFEYIKERDGFSLLGSPSC